MTGVSFDLAVLSTPADAEAARETYARCTRDDHQDGDIDVRIARFHESLAAVFPDHEPTPGSPWAVTPLSLGADHVLMRLRIGPAGEQAIEKIIALADQHDLALYDPQADETYLPRRRPGPPR
jgi:hypothetical protein